MPAPPPVLRWYRLYCASMAALYLVVTALGAFLIVGRHWIAAHDPATTPLDMVVTGIICSVMGIALTAPFIVALYLGRSPWMWIYGLIMICIGMTSLCCLPVTVPLLIFWIKPETQGWYGRRSAADP